MIFLPGIFRLMYTGKARRGGVFVFLPCGEYPKPTICISIKIIHKLRLKNGLPGPDFQGKDAGNTVPFSAIRYYILPILFPKQYLRMASAYSVK